MHICICICICAFKPQMHISSQLLLALAHAFCTEATSVRLCLCRYRRPLRIGVKYQAILPEIAPKPLGLCSLQDPHWDLQPVAFPGLPCLEGLTPIQSCSSGWVWGRRCTASQQRCVACLCSPLVSVRAGGRCTVQEGVGSCLIGWHATWASLAWGKRTLMYGKERSATATGPHKSVTVLAEQPYVCGVCC